MIRQLGWTNVAWLFIFFTKQDFSGEETLFHPPDGNTGVSVKSKIWRSQAESGRTRSRTKLKSPSSLFSQAFREQHMEITWLWSWVGSKLTFQVLEVFPLDWTDYSLGRQSKIKLCSEAQVWICGYAEVLPTSVTLKEKCNGLLRNLCF